MGALERKCGNYTEALAYLNRALELTPRHPAACVEKAIVLRKQGKTAQADTLTETALKEKTNVAYKRGTHEKHANEFVRSSEAEQVCCSAMLVVNQSCSIRHVVKFRIVRVKLPGIM